MFYRLDTCNLEELPKCDLYIDEKCTRRPAYVMRGKPVTREQAFDIISHESNPNLEGGDINISPIASNHYIRLHRSEGYDWIQSWLDFEGRVGSNSFTYKYPLEEELLEDNLNYAARYPFLDSVIIYSSINEVNWDVWNYHDGCIMPFCCNTIEDILNNFVYAVWVHDGGAEIVSKSKASDLVYKYNALYENDKVFNRDDWDKYVEHFLTEESLIALNKVWKLPISRFSSLIDILRKRLTVDEEYEYYKKVFCNSQNNVCKLRIKIINTIQNSVKNGTFKELDLKPYWDEFLV